MESEKSERSTIHSFNSPININTTFNKHNNIPKNNLINNNIINIKYKQEFSKTLKIISDLLTDICEENKIKPDYKTYLYKCFLSKKIPSISIEHYLGRLQKYGKVNDSTIILVLIYIDRICNKNKIKLSYYNIHKIILASFVIASKYNEDDYYSSKFYAQLGGVSKEEMFLLEYEFLSLINFNLFVDMDLYNKYNDNLINLEDEEEDEEEEEEENEEQN